MFLVLVMQIYCIIDQCLELKSFSGRVLYIVQLSLVVSLQLLVMYGYFCIGMLLLKTRLANFLLTFMV